MGPDPNSAIAPLLSGLNEKLLRTLISGARKFALVAGRPMTVEIYLAALFQSFPEEVGAFFTHIQPLAEMAGALSSVDVSAHEIEPSRNPGDPSKMLMLKLDEPLIRILRRVAEASRASGADRAGISDFINALRLDNETVNQLQRTRNISLRG